MKKLPEARNKDIVVRLLGKEILIYDLLIHKAYNLNETSTIVYQACNGKTSLNELKAKSSFTDEIIYLALDELRKENLIEEGEKYDSPFAGMSRREAIRKVGFASMIALPVISSLVAPTAAMALSNCIAPGASRVFRNAPCDPAPPGGCFPFCNTQCCDGSASSTATINTVPITLICNC